MRSLRTLLATIDGSPVVLGASPAAANEPTTATVTGGARAITVPTTVGSVGSRANAVAGGTISGPIGEVQVDDARSAAAGSGWAVSVLSTAFTPLSRPAIPVSVVSYSAGPIVKVGTATYTANDPGNLTGVAPAGTATGITGDNSATWTPTITVAVPGAMAANVYTATITHSVL